MKRLSRIFDRGATPILLLVVLVVLQLFSIRYTFRTDLTPRGINSLSEKTLNVLEDLEEPVRAIAFYGENDLGRSEALRILDLYRAAYPAFRYEFLDPAKNPSEVERFNIGTQGTIVFLYGDREARAIGSREERITNALLSLTRSERKVLYFVTGHGDKSPSREYREVAEALHGEFYDPQELSLMTLEAVPGDAEAVIVAGPRGELFPHEVAVLRSYLLSGGRLLLLLDPYYDGGMKDFLQDFGILLQNDAVVDQQSRIMGGEYLFPIIESYEEHPVVRQIGLASLYPVTRSLLLSADEARVPATLQAIAKTGPRAWGETNREGLVEGEAGFDQGEDIPGPLVIAASAELEPSENRGILVVFGDSDFASDDYLSVSGNRDVILNSVAWITQEEDLLSIRPIEAAHTPIILTGRSSRGIFLLAVLLFPVLYGALGVAVWRFRRSRR
ncbi:MAG: GldG family protein [Spirochaetaceae bacterium]